MDIMVRILKSNVNGGFTNDIAQAYELEDLTGYTGNLTDWVVIIRNTPFLNMQQVKASFTNNIRDVSTDPEFPIEVTRRCRYYVNWSLIPAIKSLCDSQGWADIDWTEATPALVDAMTDLPVYP